MKNGGHLTIWLEIKRKIIKQIYPFHIDSDCLLTVSSVFKTGSTLKCRNALNLDFTALTHLRFSELFTF